MLALIAGQGSLPTRIASRVPQWPIIAAVEGFPPDELIPEFTFSFANLGTLLQHLRARDVKTVCFAGAVDRPPLDVCKVDAATAPLMPQLLKINCLGDDGALRVVMTVFEQAGFEIISASDLLSDVTTSVGILTKATPDEMAYDGAAKGVRTLYALSDLDIGQSCVIAKSQVIAIETLPGTDWMLKTLVNVEAANRGVLVKLPKRGQDRRVDMPTIGPMTIENAHAAGLSGVVIASDGTMIVDAQDTIDTANRYGLFLMAMQVDE